MRLAFLIYSYFPFGGQQRDFMRILRIALARGHEVDVYALRWQGLVPDGVKLKLVPIRGVWRLTRYRSFTAHVEKALRQAPVDAVVGFNKMPYLDVYFGADPCFLEKARTQRGAYYPFTPRFRHFKAYEEAVFRRDSATQVLLLSDLQRKSYLRHYPYCAPRLHELPPGISADRRLEQRDPTTRREFREEFAIADGELLVLQVGSGFRVKGVDRSLRAIAALPVTIRRRVRYLLVGQDRATRFRWLARRLGLQNQVQIIAGREDIPRFFAGADLLLHPAYEESAGYVLLEAAIAGLPVLTTASCGYATHIQRAEAGEVCLEPFQQQELNDRLASMLKRLDTAPWSENGLAYGRNPGLYTMPEVAVDRIETLTRARILGGAT